MIIRKGHLALAAFCTVFAGYAAAAEGDEADKAREALAQSDDDVSVEKNLEEVFEASEKNYSLLKKRKFAFNVGFGYSYFRDDRIDLALGDNGTLTRFRIENDSTHSFTSSFSVDYGLRDNLTINYRAPFVFRVDTEKDSSSAALGDMSIGVRWQPFPVKPGTMNSTLFASMSLPTGDSPYEINVNTENSSGAGFVSMSGGVSISKVLDPVVLFGSSAYNLGFNASGLDQTRGSRRLEEVSPGDSVSFSFGMAYALSYDVSLSGSYSQSYNFPTQFRFTNGDLVESEDSVTSSVNLSLGLRTSKNQIYNTSFGFGLTEDSPDVTLGFSMPLEIAGLKK